MALDQGSCRTRLDIPFALVSILLKIMHIFYYVIELSWDLVNEMFSMSMLSD